MKGFRKLFIVLLVLIVTLSCTACSIYTKVDNNAGNGNGTNITDNNGGDNSQNTNITFSGLDYNLNGKNLPSSITASQNISLTQNTGISDQDRVQSSSIKDAYESVKNSAVAIFVTNGNAISSGSGTIVDIDNSNETNKNNVFYILTCHHVVDSNGAPIQVCLVDNNGLNYGDVGYNVEDYTFTGKIGGVDSQTGKIDKTQAVSLVGGDLQSDVAVLRLYIENDDIASKVQKSKIMDKKYTLNNLDEIFIIGNPTGKLAGTVTYGRVSGNLRTQTISGIGSMILRQLDAGAWHGSSGGGVYNIYGELCGILNSGSDEYIGINFAIPHIICQDEKKDNGFINIMKQLIGSATDSNYGYISNRHIKFGFTAQSVSVTGKEDTVPVVIEIVANSLAHSAGLKVNDVITQIKLNNNTPTQITSYEQFSNTFDAINVGDEIELTVQRTYVTSERNKLIEKTGNETIKLTCVQYHFCNTDK